MQTSNHLDKENIRPLSFRSLDDQELKLLKELCQSIDPFMPLEDHQKEGLSHFGIEDSDPFKITNQLLALLEENLNKRVYHDSESHTPPRNH